MASDAAVCHRLSALSNLLRHIGTNTVDGQTLHQLCGGWLSAATGIYNRDNALGHNHAPTNFECARQGPVAQLLGASQREGHTRKQHQSPEKGLSGLVRRRHSEPLQWTRVEWERPYTHRNGLRIGRAKA